MSCLNVFAGAGVLDRQPGLSRGLCEPPALPCLPQLLCAIREQPDGCACITLSVLSVIVLLTIEWIARQRTGTVSLGLLAAWILGNEKNLVFVL